jgi:hypothetical protein
MPFCFYAKVIITVDGREMNKEVSILLYPSLLSRRFLLVFCICLTVILVSCPALVVSGYPPSSKILIG